MRRRRDRFSRIVVRRLPEPDSEGREWEAIFRCHAGDAGGWTHERFAVVADSRRSALRSARRFRRAVAAPWWYRLWVRHRKALRITAGAYCFYGAGWVAATLTWWVWQYLVVTLILIPGFVLIDTAGKRK